MKLFQCLLVASLTCGSGFSQEVISYLNYIRQFQTPSGVVFDASNSVGQSGSMLSPLPIQKNGARFELWTIQSSSVSGVSEYLLSSSYVASYIPTASLTLSSSDTTSPVPRTRVDQPFYVTYTIGGLLSGATDPDASKAVTYQHHVQSYGPGGTGANLDRTQAILYREEKIEKNATYNQTFTITSIPRDGFSSATKIRGEERFTIRSLPDDRDGYHVDSLIIDSKTIQIWPVADGSISGITNGQKVRYSVPQLTLTLNDLYPFSTTYLQAYKGNPVLGTTGAIISGSQLVINDSVPNSRTLVVSNYGADLADDGTWTMELITKTPFGTDRLAYVTFELDRTMKVNGTVTTSE